MATTQLIERNNDVSALIQVTNMDAYYGLVQALRDINLEVKAGELVTVIGANGAGKTTLLGAISGLVPTSRGEIIFAGERIDGLPPEKIVRLGVSHVPERRELFDSLTVLENLKLGAYHRRKGEARAKIERDLERVWEIFPILRARKKQTAGTLSGGEQQMLAIARGLMSQPTLLLLDEPSLGLAPLLVQEVLRIVSMLRDMGWTILLVEQNASGALEIADYAYLMEVGRIVMHGSAHEFLEDERVRRAYLGQQVAMRRTLRNKKWENVNTKHHYKKSNSKGYVTRKDYSGKELNSMNVFPEILPNFTLPDEFFEQRVGYTHNEIEEIQDRVLPLAYTYAFEHSPFYQAKFSEVGLKPESIRGLGDLRRLPFTTSEQIRPSSIHTFMSQNLMTVSVKEVSLVHTSSGTTGAPKVFAYTGCDIAQWAANTATVFWINGFRKNDNVLGVMPFGEFTGGGGLYLGMIALGVTYMPISLRSGVSDKVMAHLLGKITINNHEVYIDPLLRASGMLCLGSFLPRLEEMLDQYGVQPEELSLTKISAGAEPSSDAVRTRFAERFGIWPRDNYGLGEFYGPGVAGECEVGGGLHVLSDAFIAEVIDPDSEEPASEGEMGELVLTSLYKEAIPLFRYRTGDRVMLLPNDCPCGSAHIWIGRIPGRIDTDDIMIPGGVVMNRTYLEDILLQIDGAGTQYVLTLADHPQRKGLKRLYIAIEGDPDPKLAESISHRVKVEYNHSPIVTILQPGTIPREAGKARRIIPPKEFMDLVKNSAKV